MPSATANTVADSVLTLDSTAQRLAGIELHSVDTSSAAELVANGTITYDANRVSVVASRSEGRLVSVRADLGQEVRAGSILALLQSADVGATRGELARAKSGVDIARRNYDREKRLFDEQISPQKELLTAEGELRSAEADYNAALAKLRAIGATEGEGATFGLVTPVGGTVVERNASPGQNVGPSTNLFTVADLRHVWITVDVYEGDLARVRHGAPVTVIPSALPGESFAGRITYAGGVVDTASRTFKVRVELENSGSRLRPGMFAQARIRAARAAGPASIVVPEIAVQELNGEQVVFVAGTAPGQFIVRTVTIGARTGNGSVTITSGLSAGERLVVKGAFQLKSELTKGSTSEGTERR
ncbi:MAG: efflux RND transporter periplasmic adaptor subunit [Gemmatimonadaceae bacterium]